MIAPDQRVLAVVRPGEDPEPVLRWTRSFAESFDAIWMVLCVAPPHREIEEDQSPLGKTLDLAREFGAEVITTSVRELFASTLRVATQRNVTQIIVGNSPGGASQGRRNNFILKLLRHTKGIAILAVPAGVENLASLRFRKPGSTRLTQYLQAFGVIALVTLVATLFKPWVGAHGIALVFLLTVVVLGLFLERGPTLVAASMSALLWDFFFLPPFYALRINNFEDAMLFGMYFVVALVLGHLTTRIRAQEEAERERETRATALFLLTRDLNESVDLDQMVQRIVHQVGACFRAQVAVLLPRGHSTLQPCAGNTLQIPENERQIPQWVLEHRQRAGAFTANSPFATALYLPLSTSSGPLGVLALKSAHPVGLSLDQENLVDTFAQQIAMALDRHRLNAISEQAKLLAESERLSKTLLDSMSHELRTPIAAIKSATGNLAELRNDDGEMRREMLAEIQEATERLNRVVGNVIEASRLESGALKPRLNECDVNELVHVVLEQTEKELSAHRLTVRIEPGLPMLPLDFVLTQQALANLISNAALHTPAGTAIELEARLEAEMLVITVADRGPGIPPDSLPRIFDKFYRVPSSRTGGTGLGLSLVKGFVEAQGGRVAAKNRQGGGVAFTIRLPCPNSSVASAEPEI